MHISKLTHIAFQLNGALDTGKYEISFDEISSEIKAETIFDFLSTRLADDVDFSIVSPEERRELTLEWEPFLNVNARRKFCVERNGICLLVAYLLEGIQRRCRERIPA